jgi:hypothetical protein
MIFIFDPIITDLTSTVHKKLPGTIKRCFYLYFFKYKNMLEKLCIYILLLKKIIFI